MSDPVIIDLVPRRQFRWSVAAIVLAIMSGLAIAFGSDAPKEVAFSYGTASVGWAMWYSGLFAGGSFSAMGVKSRLGCFFIGLMLIVGSSINVHLATIAERRGLELAVITRSQTKRFYPTEPFRFEDEVPVQPPAQNPSPEPSAAPLPHPSPIPNTVGSWIRINGRFYVLGRDGKWHWESSPPLLMNPIDIPEPSPMPTTEGSTIVMSDWMYELGSGGVWRPGARVQKAVQVR